MELSHPFSLKSEFTKFSYNLEKIYYLEQNSSYSYWDKQYARGLLEEVKPSINKFVVFENNESAYYCYKAVGFQDIVLEKTETYTVLGEEWKCLELEMQL